MGRGIKYALATVVVWVAIASPSFAQSPGEKVSYVTGTTPRTGTLLVETPTLDLIARAGTISTQDQIAPGDIQPVATPTPSPTPTATPTLTPSPTPTATATATPTPTACASNTPNVPDGPDPWGGCFPGPQSTGVPPFTLLTDYTGPCDIVLVNTVIDAKTITCPSGYLNIHATGVQIKNSFINGSVWIDSPGQGGSFTITDSTIDAGDVNQTYNDAPTAIGKSHFTAIRVETYRGGRGIWCEYDCKVRDSYVHGQDRDEGGHTHESGIRAGSGSSSASGQYLTHNTIRCDAPDVAPDAGCSADVTGYGDFAPIQYNTVVHNLLQDTPGGTCAYGGNTTGKPYPNGSHNVWQDNVFQRGAPNRGSGPGPGHCGWWYGMAHFDLSLTGNVFSGNRWDTGEIMQANT
jgi:hypothetical protein